MDATTGGAGAPRLSVARAALARAEQRAGLRGFSTHQAEPSAWWGLGADTSGVLSLTGSTSVLLAAAARRQGSHGWCAVVGCEGLGWAAAAEAGLALERVLAVGGALLDPGAVPAVTSALLDGVDVLLLAPRVVAALRPRDRRTLLARARERRALILSPVPWEGARSLTAVLVDVDQHLEQGTHRGPGPRERSPGSSSPRRSAAATEMPGGHIHRLVWSLRDEARPLGESWVVLDAAGARARLPVPQDARPALRLVDGGLR